jgi:hypothetical protein
VSRLVVELTEWTAYNRELLTLRFVDAGVADAYATVAEPFVVPTEGAQVEAQVELVQRQLRHQVEWLERLRLTIPDRQQPAIVQDEPHLARSRAPRRSVAVLATTASSSAAAVVGAVARATGILPVVIEDHPGEQRSLVAAAEDTLPSNAIAVVVVEPPDKEPKRASASSLLALGYAAGALGVEDVIAVLTPGMVAGRELRDFTTIVMQRGDEWRQQLEGVLERMGLTTTAVVSSIRRS